MIDLDHSYFSVALNPGGNTPLYKPYRDVTPQRGIVFGPFIRSENGIDFAHFGLESVSLKELRE